MASPNVQSVDISLIDAVDRVREVDEAWVANMADSIARKGLLNPLMVRPSGEGRYRLVLGGHRHAAVTLLGWTEVRCEIRDLDDDEARSIELDENLARRELDQLDFAVFCLERKTLDERLGEREGRGGDRRSASARSKAQLEPLKPRFTEELAAKVGRSRQTIDRAVAIARDLAPQTIAALRGTKFADNQQALMLLAEVDREADSKYRQIGIAEDLRAGKFKTVKSALSLNTGRAAPGGDRERNARADLANRFADIWDKLDEAGKVEALREITLTEGQRAVFRKLARRVLGEEP